MPLLLTLLTYLHVGNVDIAIIGEAENYRTYKIKDNGIGFDSQYKGRIFELFQRLHTRSDYEGTGLGLAICKKVVERHGGEIWIDSELDQGAETFIKFPVV